MATVKARGFAKQSDSASRQTINHRLRPRPQVQLRPRAQVARPYETPMTPYDRYGLTPARTHCSNECKNIDPLEAEK